MAGGATRSPLWLQMHADVTQLPVRVGECDNAPLLGCAVLAAAAVRHQASAAQSPSVSLSADIEQCVRDMVRQRAVILPSEKRGVREAYDAVYRQYVMLAPALAEVFDKIAEKS